MGGASPDTKDLLLLNAVNANLRTSTETTEFLSLLDKGDLRPFFRRLELAFFRSRLSWFFSQLMSRKALHLYRRVVDEVGPLPDGSRLADIGCGHGTFLATYLSQYPGVLGFGLDQSAALIDFARKQCKSLDIEVDFQVGDVHDAPLHEKAFDLIVSTSSIYCWHDPVLVLNRLFSTLKPSGRCLIWDVLPVKSLAEARGALFEQRVFGLSIPAYSEAELRHFISCSRFQGADIVIDRLIIRLEMHRSL